MLQHIEELLIGYGFGLRELIVIGLAAFAMMVGGKFKLFLSLLGMALLLEVSFLSIHSYQQSLLNLQQTIAFGSVSFFCALCLLYRIVHNW